MVEIAAMAIDAGTLSTREINALIRTRLREGPAEISVENPNARHNLAVALLQPGRVRFLGSVGYYCGGLIDGAAIQVEGSAGWGLAESMSHGHVVVHGGAGNGAAAAIRGGTVVIHGDAAARLGVSMKGGLVLVGGDCGYMAGFMGQKGTLVVCGNTGHAFADSMYATVCYVGGTIGALGTDAVDRAALGRGGGDARSSTSRTSSAPVARTKAGRAGLYQSSRRAAIMEL